MCVDRRAQVVLVLVVLTTANALLSLESKSSEVKRNDEQFQSFLRNTNNVFDSDFTVAETFDDENDDEEADDESGSGEEIIDKNTSKKSAQPYHNNSTFLLLSQAKDMLNHDTDIFPHVSKSNTVSLYNGLSRLNATLLSDNKRHHEKHKKRNSDYLLTVFDEKPSSGHQDNKKTTDNKNSKNSSLQIANLTLDRSGEELSLNHPALVKYKHRKMNKTGSVSFSKRPRKNHFVNYYKVMGGTPTLSLTQTLSKYNKTIKEISDKLKGKHTSGVVTKSRHGELSNKFTHKNGTKRNDLNELKEKLYETLKTDNTSATKTNDSKNYQESEENQKRKEREQDPETSKLQHLLSKLKFNNGATGKVRTGQEFAYISQCGLYTEPQNVSFVEHAWVTKTYSPYFYLYEKPKKYEKCKPSPWMNGTDMRGSVFLSFEVKSLHGSTMENNAKICEKYCCKEPRCAAWVLRLQSEGTSNCPPNSYCCWLKTDIPKPEPHEACVSGIVHRNHYKHPPNGMRSSVPLGALGTGSFELRADGTFHEWTIENQSPGGSAKLSKTSLEMMLLGVRVKKGKGKPRSAVLRTHAPHGYEGVESIAYSGSHPVSKLKIDLHKKLRKVVNLDLYAYSTFHPRSPKDSATPSVVFSLSISNPSNEDLDVSFMLNLPFGYNDDTIRRGNNFAEVAFTRLVTAADCQNACAKKAQCMSWTTNGPFSCMLKDGMPLHAYEYGIISGLKGVWEVKEDMLNCKRPGFYPQSGDISLYPINHGSEVTSFAVEDDPEVVWDLFKKTGHVSNVDDRSKVNSTGLNGAVSTSTRLRPKERKTLTIIFSWYFPNRGLSEERVGNFYNNLFKNSLQVAKHTENDLLNMVEDILNWQSTFIPPLSISPVKEMETKHSKSKRKCTSSVAGINTLPDCLQDILLNSLSTLRTGMWMENGRWRQWEAFDCANMDPVHVDFHRIIPYVIVYPEIAKQVMLAWGDHQLENGMIQESLSMGCLEETSKEGVAGGRMMTDVNVGFIVQAYLIYSWTNDTSFFDEIYPFAQRAMDWLIKESTKGTDLPYRKPDTYDLFELEKYDHCAYNSILYLLALSTMKKMSKLQKDEVTFRDVSNALERAEKRFDIEMWDDKREFYHAWFDDEWGSPSWLMSDVMYGQVWAYTLGIGELVDKEKIKKHLRKEEKRNDSPYGLKALTKSDNTSPLEDTSVILGDELNSCKSLENITKTESIWMSSSTDWSTLQLYLGLNPKRALEQASKSLDNYRSNLRDQWNFHGLTSSEHYGLDGLPWATSHYTFHLVLWHLPMALSGQQYFAPDGKLSFTPKYEPPYWLPFYTPQCMGNIEAKEIVTESEPEIMYGLKVSSGICLLRELSISDSKYAKDNIIVNQGETIKWSAPKKTKKDIVKEILDQLKH